MSATEQGAGCAVGDLLTIPVQGPPGAVQFGQIAQSCLKAFPERLSCFIDYKVPLVVSVVSDIFHEICFLVIIMSF